MKVVEQEQEKKRKLMKVFNYTKTHADIWDGKKITQNNIWISSLSDLDWDKKTKQFHSEFDVVVVGCNDGSWIVGWTVGSCRWNVGPILFIYFLT